MKWISLLWLVLSFTLVSTGEVVQREISREYQIKAVFLFNFTQFVEWPEAAFPTPDGPFVIGIIGRDPFGTYLQETVQGEKMQGHPLVVKRIQSPDEAVNCHILFVNASDKADIQLIVEKARDKPVLTVGDAPNFAAQGGMIRFLKEDNKIRIQINLEATRQANVMISSKLLNLADIVETQPH
jgi:hypothetical protein